MVDHAEDLFVRDLHPGTDLRPGPDTEWDGSREWVQPGLTAGVENDVYKLDTEDRDRVVVLFGIGCESQESSATVLLYSATGTTRRRWHLGGGLVDSSLVALFDEPVTVAGRSEGPHTVTIVPPGGAGERGERLVFHGVVAEVKGTTVVPHAEGGG